MSARTFFDVFETHRRFHLDAQALETQYLALSRKFHPDRFAKASPKERVDALRKTTELNDAYRVLKDPRKRAEYLLKLEGIDLGDERPASAGGQDMRVKVDPQLLMEVMERNEELAEARAEGDAEKVHRIAESVGVEREATWKAVEEGFSAYEAGDREKLAQVAQALIWMRYLARMLEQVEAFDAARGDDGAPIPHGGEG